MVNTSFTDFQAWAARSRGWVGLLILAPFTIGALLSTPFVWEGGWGDFGFDAVAWALFFVGAAIRWWATLYIESRKGVSLVTEGPYSLCRNPLYVGTLCMAASVAIYLKSLTFAVGLTLAAVIYLSTTVPVEERRLLAKLGDEYAMYCRVVPRFLPRLNLFRTSSTLEVSTRGLVAESLRAARWIWIPIACELFAHLRAESWWPRILNLP